MAGVPVSDVDVQEALRKLNEPRLVFGESPMVRRLRLLAMLKEDPTLLASVALKTATAMDTAEEEETEVKPQRTVTMYPIAENPERLANVRWMILQDSLRASHRRAQEEGGGNKRPRDAGTPGPQTITMVSSEVASSRPLSCIAPGAQNEHWVGDVAGNIVALREGQRIEGTADDKPTYEASSRVMALLPLPAHDCVVSAHITPTIQVHRPGGVAAQSLAGHKDRVNRLDALYLSTGGPLLFSTSHDTSWCMWDIGRGDLVLRQPGHASAIFGLAVHPDGGLVATGDATGLTFLWDTRIGRRIAVLRTMTTEVLSLAFSPDGRYLAAAGGDNVGRIHDMRSSFSECQTLLGHSSLISQVAWRSNDSLTTASFDKTVAVWHAGSTVAHASCAGIARGHDAKVMGVVASPDESTAIVSAGFDRTVKVWSVE
jgi:WD40 repeat protein